MKPTAAELPQLNSSFHEIKGILTKYDQVSYFKELWGEDYYKKIEYLWGAEIETFKVGGSSSCDWRESLLVITFDYYLGPYIGLPEDVKLKFYRWLVENIKNRL